MRALYYIRVCIGRKENERREGKRELISHAEFAEMTGPSSCHFVTVHTNDEVLRYSH